MEALVSFIALIRLIKNARATFRTGKAKRIVNVFIMVGQYNQQAVVQFDYCFKQSVLRERLFKYSAEGSTAQENLKQKDRKN